MKKSKIRVIIGVILSLIILVILVALIFNTSALIKNTKIKIMNILKKKIIPLKLLI